MKLEIVQVGNPILRQHARTVHHAEILSADLQKLIASMRETMHSAPGVGLAAPQVGVALQLAVIEDREEYHKDVERQQLRERERWPVPFHVLINPKISELYVSEPATAHVETIEAPKRGAPSERPEFFEGCLSLSGFSAVVPRERKVRVEYLNERGEKKVVEASGWYARILQHEIDHLNGILYIDRMYPRTFGTIENWKQFSKDQPIADIVR